ncbi:MAG: hypothetical protein GXO22_06370 [Aquificae bacterium]|nr:hypothetical protein [Aquificota bacterium]
MIRIDLKTKKKKDFKGSFESKLNIWNIFHHKEVIVAIVGLILIGLGLLYFFSLKIQERNLLSKKEYLLEEKKKLSIIQRKIRSLQEEVKKTKKLKERYALRKDILDELLKQKSNIKDVLLGIGSSIPEGIWIENMRISKSSVNLNGYTFVPENIYSFFKQLKQKYPDLKLGTLGRTKFCKNKDMVLCIEKPRKVKNSNFEFYTFSLNLKNLIKGEESD